MDVTGLRRPGPSGRERRPRGRGTETVFRGGAELGQGVVAHGYGYVAQESGVAGALDRGVVEHGAEFGFGERGHTLQGRGEVARGEGGLCCRRGAAIPGTDVLADVASEDVAADGRAMLFGNGRAQRSEERRVGKE